MRNSLSYKLVAVLILLLLVTSLALSCVGQRTIAPSGTQVSTPITDPIKTDAGLVAGTVVGEAGKEVHVYKGIPFAAPPVGDLRWKPPQPVKPWDGVLECKEYAPICPQQKTRLTTEEAEQSEDCLYLNVFTPARRTTDRLPVFVYIHGGAMVIGSSRLDLSYFARENNVVAVSIAYRLGGLGFFAHPLLDKESEKRVSGNYGLMDQVAALQWIQRNISAFGGDPNNVTVYGCSSGGESVLFLMASPFGKGLFHKAIADAGMYGNSRTPPLAEMEKRGEALVAKLGVSDAPDLLAALRSLSAEKIVAAVPVSTTGSDLQLPNVDGWFLPDYPLNIFQAGKQQNVPLMIGSGSNDLAGSWNQYFDKAIATAMSSVSSPVYVWVFDHGPCGSKGGSHCLSTAYLFSDLSKRQDMCDVDIKVAKAMVSMWVQFARTGTPSIPGLIEWPPYDAATDRYLRIGEPLEVRTGLYRPQPAAAQAVEWVTYTNSEYNFSLKYPASWKPKAGDLGPKVVWRVGAGEYNVPAVRVIVRDRSEGADLKTVFAAHLAADGNKTIDTFDAREVTIDGIEATQAEVTYTGAAGKYDATVVGVVKNSKWIIIEVFTLPIYFPFIPATLETDIVNSVNFR